MGFRLARARIGNWGLVRLDLEGKIEHARVGGPPGQGAGRVAGPASRSARSSSAMPPGSPRLAWAAARPARVRAASPSLIVNTAGTVSFWLAATTS
jgi:hypothetical protein